FLKLGYHFQTLVAQPSKDMCLCICLCPFVTKMLLFSITARTLLDCYKLSFCSYVSIINGRASNGSTFCVPNLYIFMNFESLIIVRRSHCGDVLAYLTKLSFTFRKTLFCKKLIILTAISACP